ncbi:hypothetical protein CVU37_03715 [candidate division BRC1 bacterium HGW-BRC1-1]|jgi:DNA-binding response OmpR family regulator|nr:MAG: hypothetical protein CVU37_03715 [candidate division BRC1 bacterium HGW-BRC1-1]
MRVLVVDDEPDMLYIITELLRGAYEVDTAPSSYEALERIGQVLPDAVVMDISLTGMDGIDAARAIRKDSRFLDTPILFLTARNHSEKMIQELKDAGERVLRKPFVASEFLQQIDAMLRDRVPASRPAAFGAIRAGNALPRDASSKPFNVGAERPRTLSEQLADAAAEPRVRILAVDDDADTVEFIGSLLRPDYEFIGTIDSTSAPDKIIAYQPDVLLLDINMPHLNGFHLSHLIRLNKRLKGAKVIFVSSRSDRESVEQAFRLGACEFIEKPFTPDQLRRKILEVIQRPDFQRNKKRVDYRELQRREGEIT